LEVRLNNINGGSEKVNVVENSFRFVGRLPVGGRGSRVPLQASEHDELGPALHQSVQDGVFRSRVGSVAPLKSRPV